MKPVSKPLETQVSSNSGFSMQQQIQSPSTVDYKFESSPASTPCLENMKKAMKTIEKEIKTLSSDMKNIQKSQKVVESILTNMNKRLLKLESE